MAQALIVIDTQHDFLREGNLASDRCLAVLPTIQREVDRALNAGERVFFTADTHEETELEGLLHRFDIDEVRICGVCTDICVLHTTADLRNRDIAVSVVADATATFDAPDHPGDVQRFSLSHMQGILGAAVE